MPIDWESLISPIITLITSGVGRLFNYLQNKKTPVLTFDTFTKTDNLLNPIYFVRVKNSNGEEKAKNCSGIIDIGSSHSRTVWANQSDKCDISHESHEDLRLFRIEFEKITSPIQEKLIPQLLFIPTLKPENLKNKGEIFDESRKSFEDYRDKEITIRVDADRGKPISLTKKISKIIDEAIVEK